LCDRTYFISCLSTKAENMVCLNDEKTAPTFFVARAEEIKDKIKEYDSKGGYRGILNYGSINSEDFLSRWDKIDAALRSPDARTV
jgi:hypothetical protein